MEENERKPVKAEQADSASTAAPLEAPSTAVPDWRSQFFPESRQKVINNIIETLKKSIPLNSESYNGLKDIALKFEGKMYASATSQNDYLRKISLKMMTTGMKTSNTGQTNPSTSNNGNQKPADSASPGMQSQASNQEQLLAVPLVNQSPASQCLLTQNLHNTTTSVALQDSRGVPLATAFTPGITGSTMPTSVQTSNMPNMSSLDIYANVQRQIQGRQQQQQKQNQHQSQSSFHQLQQQIVKQKFQQSSILQPHLKQQQMLQQQQYLLRSPQPLSSPKSPMQISSSLQSGHSGIQLTQSATMQTARISTLQQNQLNSVQQSKASLLQKHPQLVPRQQLQHITSHQQQPSTIPQHASLTSSQQQLQHLTRKKLNMLNMQQIQLFGQQKDAPEMQQQQRLPMQQHNLLNMWQPQQTSNQLVVSLHQQPQLGPQTDIMGLQQQEQKQQQQQQLVESLPNVPEVQLNQNLCQMQAIQQTQTATQQRQHQIQPSQQLAMQQNPNSLHGEVQQGFQTSGSFLYSQSAIEHRNQCFEPQKGFPDVSFSTSMDSMSQNSTTVDWQEEICQKLKSMKELYLMELDEFHQKIVLKLQQVDSLIPLEKQSEYYSKLKYYKGSVEHALAFLQMTKNDIPPLVRDRLPQYEKRINQLVSIARSKKGAPLQPQQQLQYPGGHAPSIIQQLPSQSEPPQHDVYIKKVQEINMQGSVTSTHSSATSSMQHGSVPSLKQSDVLEHKNTGETLHTNYNLNSDQRNSCNSMQQGAVVSLLQEGMRSLQNMTSAPQQTDTLPQNSMNTLQPNESAMQLSHIMVQQQNLKQQEEEQKMMQVQSMKQHLRQHHVQQQQPQLIQQQQKQPLLQLHQQQKQQKMSQLPVYQMAQHQQLNEFSDLKARQESGIKLGIHQKHFSSSQHPNFCHQQLSLGGILSISSPQNFQASSPPLLWSPSPQVNNPSLLPSLTKSEMPLQSANSPCALLSPSTLLSQSSVTVDYEKQLNYTSTLLNVGCSSHQQTALAPVQAQSLAIVTPGISASSLLAEFTRLDESMAIVQSGKPSVAERPVERLIKAVQSLSPDVLHSTVNDMGSVVSMINRIGHSAPGNSSRAAIGEDLAAMANCHLQATTTKNMRRCITAMPFDNVLSTGNITHISRESFCLDASELESTATSSVKRQRVEVNQNIAEEIKEINRWLIDTAVSTCSRGVHSIAAAGEGTVVEFSFAAMTVSPNLRSHFASAHMSPVIPLKLFVPSGYPGCSPVLLHELPAEQRSSEEFQDLSFKVKSRFGAAIRGLSQPMSLWEMARTWDVCSRKVITEYAEQNGGGSFSSIYGSWENCVGA